MVHNIYIDSQNNQKLIFKGENISKNYPGTKALENINFSISSGEVIGLVGENGAGKSTLVKIISGVIKKDNGIMLYKDKLYEPDSPQYAQNLGIVTIHQELSLCPNLNVAQNLLLGNEPRIKNKTVFTDSKQLRKKSSYILKEIGFHNIDISKPVSELSIASMQMIEIARALSRDASLILMDEPTSSLADDEVNTLFEIVRKLKNKGIAIIFISHRLQEVINISDKIVVMRDGHISGFLERYEFNEKAIIQLMVGRGINLFSKENITSGDSILKIKNISDSKLVKDVSLTVKKGEIVGLAGLVGSGRSEVAHIIIGARKFTQGKILINDSEVKIKNPMDGINHGIALVPEDRKIQGLILNLSVKDNITLPVLNKIGKMFGIINRKMQSGIAKKFIKSFSINTRNIQQIVSTLSGGNQQKVVLSKWLSTEPKVLILDEPTRGIDVGSKAEVHKIMSHLTKKGIGILMISSELPEILGMSDRIVVMCQGRVTGELSRNEANEEKIMSLATLFS